MTSPWQTNNGPVILPVTEGGNWLTVTYIEVGVPFPQELNGVTVTVPVVALPQLIDMLLVPFPETIVVFEGTSH